MSMLAVVQGRLKAIKLSKKALFLPGRDVLPYIIGRELVSLSCLIKHAYATCSVRYKCIVLEPNEPSFWVFIKFQLRRPTII